ncbi:sialate O-acetylesterase [Yeosuana marina]|uniref:sialate O-acetylesterase n=1 Tax=Yeosuana marina TaxID=1565536 RepID=UPI0030EE3ED0|tara:strand:+ start:4759 stop:6201 length:1443 start_codon:yes stop_codon:yes gene_type:complete
MSNLSFIKSQFFKIFCLGLFLTGTISFSQSQKNILVLGDSNGALDYGWVNQLKTKLPNDNIFNTSRPGNTIGFDNNGRVELNTLKNLDYYLKTAQDSLGRIDYVIMMLGTNDAKYVFKDRQDEVVSNMKLLITRINNYNFKSKPHIIIMSPPPYGSDNILAEKYQGGLKRVKRIARNFKKVAKTYDCDFVNVYKALKDVFNRYTKDGVHLEKEGQKAIANLVLAQLAKEKSENKYVSNLMDIYLLIGQSNMAGRAPIELQDRDSISDVYLFTSKNDKPWEKTANPVNKYSTVRKDIAMQKLSLGYEFAHELHQTYPDIKIGLVVNARGGTSIEEWKPGEKLYNAALNQTRKALKYGVLKGIIWHQGESNVLTYKSYMPKIIELIKSFRRDFNNKNLPFIVGQLSSDRAERNDFNTMILKLPNALKNVGVVSSEGTKTIDKTHFDSASQRLLGKRYAQEMIAILNSTPKRARQNRGKEVVN